MAGFLYKTVIVFKQGFEAGIGIHASKMEFLMAKGVVKWFDPQKGFGFLLNEDGIEVFIHYSEIDKEGFRCLKTGQQVEYNQIETHKGLQAKRVQVVSKESLDTELVMD